MPLFDPAILRGLFVPLLGDPHWQEGRQGTGYRKLDLRQRDLPALSAVRASALALLAPPLPDFYDEWLLQYLPGDFIPPHRDPPLADGLAHLRLNILVLAGEGGSLFLNGEPHPLLPGEAILFRPDRVTHAVETVRSGMRLVWSLGTNLPEADLSQRAEGRAHEGADVWNPTSHGGQGADFRIRGTGSSGAVPYE